MYCNFHLLAVVLTVLIKTIVLQRFIYDTAPGVVEGM